MGQLYSLDSRLRGNDCARVSQYAIQGRTSVPSYTTGLLRGRWHAHSALGEGGFDTASKFFCRISHPPNGADCFLPGRGTVLPVRASENIRADGTQTQHGRDNLGRNDSLGSEVNRD